ncbi:lysylphosphatidylglycerol synthase domain-containing protein [Aquibium oceanicum]|uniref:lysylphosphatidylglycerol synthase domain-containing protein n=1 Tax=Aquibium oceanicum TaxID=1670800 RepID=UPI000AEE41CE|nr:lysylphosphatidylglycerol synthase domain-containing protein [Aquibium oceanicum]
MTDISKDISYPDAFDSNHRERSWSERLRNLRPPLGLSWSAWLGLVAVLLAGFLLYRTLSGYSLGQLADSISTIPIWRLGAALGFAAASYACLTVFDYLALRYVKHPLPYPKAALTSFSALSLGHSIGFSGLSSGAIRYRFYSRWGLSIGEVAKLVLFCGTTVALGMIALGGIALLLESEAATELTGFGRASVVALGAACLASLAIYLALAAWVRKPLKFRKWEIEMPSLRLALAQVGIGAANFACVAACLHQTISAFAEVPYVTVAAAFIIANTAALLAHVPGGLGVIEAVVVHLISQDGVIAAVLVFRFVYFLVPLAVGAVTFGIAELVLRRKAASAS